VGEIILALPLEHGHCEEQRAQITFAKPGLLRAQPCLRDAVRQGSSLPLRYPNSRKFAFLFFWAWLLKAVGVSLKQSATALRASQRLALWGKIIFVFPSEHGHCEEQRAQITFAKPGLLRA